jgi:AcrR family transcriptional regulator
MLAGSVGNNPGRGGKKQTRHQRRFSKTRSKLTESARGLFAEKGLDLVTVDDITERADVGRGTFYYHFNDTGDLISDLMKEVLTDLIAQIEVACADETELTGLLDAMIKAHVDFFSHRWEDFVLFYQGRADLTLAESYQGLETPFMEYLNCIEKLVDSAVVQPISKPVLRRLACAIAGFISGYYSFAVISTDDQDVDKTFMSLRSAFVASLARFITEALPDTRKRRH